MPVPNRSEGDAGSRAPLAAAAGLRRAPLRGFGAPGLPGVDGGPGSLEIPRGDPESAAPQRGSPRPLPGPGVASDSSDVGVCVCDGEAARGALGAAAPSAGQALTSGRR